MTSPSLGIPTLAVGGPPAYPEPSSPLVSGGEAWISDFPFSATGAIGANFLFAYPAVLRRTGIIDRLGVFLQVNGGAGRRIRMGMYDFDPNTLYPTQRLADTGDIVADAGAGAIISGPVNVNVRAGRFVWIAYVTGLGVAPAPTVNVPTVNTVVPIMGMTATGALNFGWFLAFPYAALPDPFPAGASGQLSSGNLINVMRRYAT